MTRSADEGGDAINFLAEREEVLREAESWIGTRFDDCQRRKQVRNESGKVVDPGGVDCLQFAWSVFHKCGHTPYLEHEQYSAQWFLHRSEEKILGGLIERAHLTTRHDPANIIVYRVGRCFGHCGIISKWPEIIHADKNVGSVCRAVGNQGYMAARNKNVSNYLVFSVWPE